LFHTAAALAKSQKSREAADLMHEAQALARQYPDAQVPLHLRNAPTKLMKNLGYNEGYEWKANFKHEKGFLPDEITGQK
jgi:putative ATPase